jgi:hypothetical protein
MDDPSASPPATTATPSGRPSRWRPLALGGVTMMFLAGVSLAVPPREDVPVWGVPVAGGVLVGLRAWLRARVTSPGRQS